MMTVWLVRAGSQGQYEQKFLQDKRIYLTWDDLNIPLDQLQERSELMTQLQQTYGDEKPRRLSNNVGQIWPFAHVMKQGDRVILPSKQQPVIYVGVISSDYQHQMDAENPYFHWRSVQWEPEGVPRLHFSQDLLYSFGAFLTICQIKRNNAEERLSKMAASGWQPESQKQIVTSVTSSTDDEDASDERVDSDLEELGHGQIIKLIEAKFKGHNLTRLVKAILEAQGYTCWQSPEGADGGVDILAGDGPMGFGEQSICVEVKSGGGLIDRPTVDKLMGAMTKFNATRGLFIAWGGFKSNVQKELASSFFRVRLWSQQDLLEQLFLHYDKLDDEIKAELPLKRIWTVATVD
ncbi:MULTISPECIES: restriction endonuclease [unclassified Endozoicomonas]|uniref:restriction endonuclease n=1 Tax=unclassified Endozoicomonas TaxID=2644528 RepID=UPI003BB58E04